MGFWKLGFCQIFDPLKNPGCTEPLLIGVLNPNLCLQHCVQEVFKDAISKPLPTPSIAVSTMQEAMHPQVGFLHALCTQFFPCFLQKGILQDAAGWHQRFGNFGFCCSHLHVLEMATEACGLQKQTVLVQDENQLLENGLRSLLQEVVVSLSFHS